MASPHPNSPKSIVVLQTAFLGDIVLTAPLLRALRAEFPKSRVVMLTTPIGKEILSPNPWNIEFLVYDKHGADRGLRGQWRVMRELRALKADTALVVHRSWRSGVLALASGAKTRLAFTEAANRWVATRSFSRATKLFEAEKNLALLEGLGVRGHHSPFPELFADSNLESVAANLLRDFAGKDFVAIAPSSVWATKRWPAEYFADLALALWEKEKIPSVFVGGGGATDRSIASAITKELPAGSFLDLTGRTSLGVMKALLGRARLVVANDSAPLHIAIGRGRAVVGIFGSTTKELGFFPLAPEGKAAVAEIVGLECRPCGAHGHDACPLVHFRCMRELSVEKVFSVVRTQWQACKP